MNHDQKSSSHYQCTYLLLVICFLVRKISNVFILTTVHKTTYTNHKPSYEYSFFSNHIWPPLTQLTKAFPWVCIWSKHIGITLTLPTHTLHRMQTNLQTQTHMHTDSYAHTYTCKLVCAQPSLYKNIYVNLNTHAHGLTCTQI